MTADETPRGLRWRNWVASAAFVIGLTSFVGDATGLRVFKGIGAATVAAPLPKVFSAVRGYETFAADFTFLITRADGEVERRPITPKLYARLTGPYNRRNVYGAALSYAPRLPPKIWQAVFCYGLGSRGSLRREFAIPDDASDVRVLIESKTRGNADQWTLEAECSG